MLIYTYGLPVSLSISISKITCCFRHCRYIILSELRKIDSENEHALVVVGIFAAVLLKHKIDSVSVVVQPSDSGGAGRGSLGAKVVGIILCIRRNVEVIYSLSEFPLRALDIGRIPPGFVVVVGQILRTLLAAPCVRISSTNCSPLRKWISVLTILNPSSVAKSWTAAEAVTTTWRTKINCTI
jgi:hypothetical protein